MAIRAEDVRTELTLIERAEGTGPQPKAVPAGERRDYRLLYEREVARAGEAESRAKAAEARAEEFRCAEVRTRFESASWKHRYELSRRKLTRVVEQTKAIRGTANNAQSLQGSQHRKDTIKSLRTERGGLRKALRRSRRQKTTIKSLYKENARLRRAAQVSQSRKEALSAELAEVRASRAVLSKWLYGRRSEQQDKFRSARRRGQQPGAPGHGRTPRPGLEERIEIHQPPAEACVCGRMFCSSATCAIGR